MSIQNPTLIDRLFKAGAHFGFKKSRRHPTVAPYLFGTKEGNDIIDLEKTTELLAVAKETLKEAGQQGKVVLMVGTKDEAAPLVKAAAEKIGVAYVTNRWIGGMLTNFSEMKKRVNRMEALAHERASGELERKYTKKERVVLGRESDKLEFNFRGFSILEKQPDLMLVVDPRHDKIAVAEAIDRKIPLMAIMSSDCDAAKIQYPVIANDSLQQSVSLLLDELTAAYSEGKATFVPTAKPAHDRPRHTRRES
jgi:small subunit ribosomal protein S2